MRVAIIGCGYVGLALARRLVADGHDVIGVRRSRDRLDEIEAIGAAGAVADLTDVTTLRTVPAVDVLVVSASAAGGDAKATRRLLVHGLSASIAHFGERERPPNRVVYTSTTGVYGDYNGAWVDETTRLAPTSPKTAVLAEAELTCREEAVRYGMDPVIVRLGGVYGPDRYRISAYLSKPVYPGYRNLLHRTDAAGVLARLTRGGAGDHDTVIAVDNEPVDRVRFVRWLANESGVTAPPAADPGELLSDPDRSFTSKRRLFESKRCDNARLQSLGYEFVYPTFRDGYAEAVTSYRRS